MKKTVNIPIVSKHNQNNRLVQANIEQSKLTNRIELEKAICELEQKKGSILTKDELFNLIFH